MSGHKYETLIKKITKEKGMRAWKNGKEPALSSKPAEEGVRGQEEGRKRGERRRKRKRKKKNGVRKRNRGRAE
jgi:uncharacterized membrane protein YukC